MQDTGYQHPVNKEAAHRDNEQLWCEGIDAARTYLRDRIGRLRGGSRISPFYPAGKRNRC
jgi:hypothetical protein